MAEQEPILFCWSGGKDSAMALHALSQQKSVRVTGLLTTITEGFERVSMHGVRRELLQRQAASVGLPLQEVRIPPQCVNPIYEARMEAAMRAAYEQGIRKIAFGDIFLEDLRVYRERNLARAGMEAVFPIWRRDTKELAREFLRLGFRARVVCIDPRILDHNFAGRELDESFFKDLPPHADPCGENGEFHTFVYDGPILKQPVKCKSGEVVERDSFVFCDLLAEEEVLV
jgi:uncharacterized protein (TIGR00290 family)